MLLVKCEDLSDKDKTTIETKLKAEYSVVDLKTFIKLLRFQLNELSILNHVDLTKGRLTTFLDEQFPDLPYKISPLYKAIFDEVKLKTDFEASVRDFETLRSHKSITRQDFEKHLKTIQTKFSAIDFASSIENRLNSELVPIAEVSVFKRCAARYKINKMSYNDRTLNQDKSWNSNWSSFSKLYLPNARTDIANYHTGIRPNAFYVTKGELGITNDQIANVDKELGMIRNLLKTLKSKLSDVEFSIGLIDFETEIRTLLVSCNELNGVQNNLKHQLSHLSSRRINLEAQLTITKNAMIETHKDYEYAVNDLPAIVSCPSCGAEYENSFGERFGIAVDEEQCYNLTLELQEELARLESEVDLVTKKYYDNDILIAEIQRTLESKQQEVKLRDVIESEGKKEVQNMLQKEIQAFDSELREKLLLKKTLEDRLGQIDDKEKTTRIKDQYVTLMRRFLQELNIHTLSDKNYKRIDSTIKESGSTTPRAMLAYYYSILHVIKANGSSAFCPIVIDSPNQQGQDSENLPLMLNFIINHQPKNSQLILALEQTNDIDFKGKLIELTEVRHLLSEDDYADCFNEIRPFLDQLQIPGIQTALFE